MTKPDALPTERDVVVGSLWRSLKYRGTVRKIEDGDATSHLVWVSRLDDPGGPLRQWHKRELLESHYPEVPPPDALPVEGASIAEALEALDAIMATARYGRHRDDYDAIRSALERAAAEGEAHRWIPVGERMPAEGAPVWAFDEGEVCPAYWSGQFWWVAGDGPTLDCVTEWMPRYVPPTPAPPKGSTP